MGTTEWKVIHVSQYTDPAGSRHAQSLSFPSLIIPCDPGQAALLLYTSGNTILRVKPRAERADSYLHSRGFESLGRQSSHTTTGLLNKALDCKAMVGCGDSHTKNICSDPKHHSHFPHCCRLAGATDTCTFAWRDCRTVSGPCRRTRLGP